MTDTEYLYLSPECTEDILSEPKGFVNENARFSQSGRPLKPVPKAGRLSFHTGISHNTQPIGHRRIGAVFSRQENIYTSAFNTPHCLCVQRLSRYLPYPAGCGYRLGVRHRCRRLPCYPPGRSGRSGSVCRWESPHSPRCFPLPWWAGRRRSGPRWKSGSSPGGIKIQLLAILGPRLSGRGVFPSATCGWRSYKSG